MITYEILENYDELKDVAEGTVPDKERSRVIVARDGDRIVGRIVLIAPVHLEGVYVAPERRGTELFNGLMQRAEKEAKELGLSKVFGYAVNDVISDYLSRLGYRQEPWTVWVKEI